MASAPQRLRVFLAQLRRFLRTPKRRSSLRVEVEQLEDRLTPAAGLQEQYMLELINRMRENPAAELSILLNSNDPSVQNALDYFQVDRNLLAQQWATLTAAAPLAWNDNLASAAALHNQFMIRADVQSHQVAGEPGLGTRFLNAGYNNFSLGAENIFAYADTVFGAHAAFAIDWGYGTGGIQTPAGHRNNIMNANLREVGLSVMNAPSGSPLGPLVVTQDFGSRFNQGNPYFLGSVYGDTDRDGYYSYGEGLAGVTVRIVNNANGAVTTTTTSAAGGFQVQLASGTYSVTVSGGAFIGTASRTITIGSANVRANFVNGTGVVNTPPTLAPIATQTIQQGASVLLTLAGSDANNDTLTYSARLVNATPAAPFAFVVSGNRLTVTPPTGFIGAATIEVAVHDGRGGSATQSFVLNVLAPPSKSNTAPVLAALPSVDLFSGHVGRVALSATDAESNPLTYSAELLGSFATPPATLAVSGNRLSIATASGFVGAFDVRVTVSDGSLTSSKTLRVTVSPEGTPIERLSGDFNGDGAGDVLTVNADGSLWLGVFGAGDTVALSRWGQLPTTGWRKLQAGDVNGDGRTDFLGFTSSGQWYIGLSTGTGIHVVYGGGWNTSAEWKEIFFGDFNGDGRLDGGGLHQTGSVYIAQSTGAGLQHLWGAYLGNTSAIGAVLTGDFNGDRREDLVTLSQTGTWSVHFANGASSGALFTSRTAATGWTAYSNWRNLLVGDFNGDGRADVAGQYWNGQWYIGLANGASSGASFTLYVGSLWSSPSNLRTVFVADVDRDGRSDIVGVTQDGAWNVMRLAGSSFVSSPWGTNNAGAWTKSMPQERTGNVLQFAWDGSWDLGESSGSSFAFRRILRVRDF